MNTYQITSAQTGNDFGTIQAKDKPNALDLFAQSKGYESCFKMWDSGAFEYIVCEKVAA